MATDDRRTQVYLIDNSLTMRAMMDVRLGRDDDIEICGMASDATTALTDIERLWPDVVLLDLNLPGMDGLEFLEALESHWRPMHVIAFSRSTPLQSAACHLALNRGAVACFDKSKLINNWSDLVELIEDVCASEDFLEIHDSEAFTLPIN